MSTKTAEGFAIEGLEGLPLGAGKYELRLYTYAPIGQEKLDQLQKELVDGGASLLGAIGETVSMPNTVVMRFEQSQASNSGVGFVIAAPFAVLLIGALGAVGVAGLLGWSIKSLIGDIGETIKKSFIPAILILGGIYVLGKYVGRK